MSETPSTTAEVTDLRAENEELRQQHTNDVAAAQGNLRPPQSSNDPGGSTGRFAPTSSD